ncbi:Uncharacterized conserved protein, DUF1330 family [Pseudoxanthomonas sp. GM95]|nr:Uncharacterized conserved protein, DUF1330 family [Pseudoxanthomonas sp. GM95]
MSAYVVMIRERVTDPDALETYARNAPQAREGHDITPLARYGALDVLEGPPMDGVLIHRFPTIEQARDWYHSSAYQTAKVHRERGADYRVFIVEGVKETEQ